MNQCERCGIDEDDPRAQQACAAVESDSPYHRFPKPRRVNAVLVMEKMVKRDIDRAFKVERAK